MPWQFHEDVPMSMKRIRQMADPLLPQDAATRKWVEDKIGTGGGGGTGADEVLISDVTPTAPSTELWVDWDAAPPDVSGADEVAIQNEQPDSQSSVELWLDLDAPNTLGEPALDAILAGLMAEVARLRADLDALREG